MAQYSRYSRKLTSVAILDPSIASRNAGDEIISDAARREIERVLPHHFQAIVPTHEKMGIRSWRLAAQSEYKILAGSNILTTDLFFDRGWRYSFVDTFFVKDIISLATGWRSYKHERAFLGKMMLLRALHGTALHSVRDEYTRRRLKEAGVQNVINTSCVTMWNLDIERLSQLPQSTSENVVTAVNFGRSSAMDNELAEALLQTYRRVFVWPQGIEDVDYVTRLFGGKAEILGPTLAAYDRLLQGDAGVDFVGTRLHGGIRALQHGRRALIAAVDNRAEEIARDTGLPILDRSSGLVDQIRAPKPINISLPHSAIDEWRSQFG